MRGQNMKLGFIGLGLIGGSIAKALKQAEPEYELIAYDIDERALMLAVKEGVITQALSEVNEAFGECDVVFLCAPVTQNDANLQKLAGYLKKDAILTDVGSVKGDIHTHIESMGLSDRFIGGHPMAGSEKTGYENARANLFENAYYMITPTKQTTEEALEQYKTLVKKTGAIPLVLSPEKHDYVTGAISHLPHVIAASLVNLIREEDKQDGVMKMIAAGGFRDITRIASSSPAMWEAICMTNTENIVKLLDAYIESLQSIRKTIGDQDSEKIYEFFSHARDYRDSFTEAVDGPIRKVYACHVDIPDEAGSLAKIAAFLADQQISIKNIGIIHNREYEEGVLRIEFYDYASKEKADEVLAASGYRIYDK